MFQINEVYQPTQALPKIRGLVRVVDSVGLDQVVLIHLDTATDAMPFFVNYVEWVEWLDDQAIEKAPDPFLRLTSSPRGLPKGATKRLERVVAVTTALCQKPDLFHTPLGLTREIGAIAVSMKLSRRTVKRWVVDWLQAGRNPAAVVRTFVEPSAKAGTNARPQSTGAKRGRKGTKPETASHAAAHEVRELCEKAFQSYVKGRRMTWDEAYCEMLVALCGIPAAEVKLSKSGVLMDPVLIQKYRLPTWPQCRYVFRLLKEKQASAGKDLPRGKRGKAHDNIPGPGFYEIDATHFQIQLVSRVTGAELVGRPTVYLIVDIFDGVIVGYAVTLENPSWAVAALALYNCFSDKGAVFARLGLPFTSEDWPCHHLPTVLRADRAELVSNMGQAFPTSGIRVEVAPSMVSEAKGTVEGKHSEVKKERPGRFDLPGRFKKARERREKDGKAEAALNIEIFERILVEIIMDINGEPVDPRRIPPDAFPLGGKVGSRVGLHRWSLKNRAGFTRQMGANFVYEHLLTNARGTVTALGIKYANELFNCDRLRELGYLLAAVSAEFQIRIAFNPLYAGEVFFYDKERDQWISAANVDLEIERYRMTFAEAKEYRASQSLIARQAGLNNHSRRRERTPIIRKQIKDAVAEKAQLGVKTKATKASIRENRKQEQARQRSAGFNGLLLRASSAPSAPSALPAAKAPASAAQANKPRAGAPSVMAGIKQSATDALSLWDEVDAGKKP